MANTEVLLIKPIEGLGGEGQQVKVRAGYARNYLLPRGIAVPISQSNRKQIEVLQKRRVAREADELDQAQGLAAKIQALHVAIAVKTGEGGKLFGAVTSADLLEKLTAAGFPLDKRKLHLEHPVKNLGKHTVQVRLHKDVRFDLEFEVVSENPVIPAAEEKSADAEEDRPARKPRRAVKSEAPEAAS